MNTMLKFLVGFGILAIIFCIIMAIITAPSSRPKSNTAINPATNAPVRSEPAPVPAEISNRFEISPGQPISGYGLPFIYAAKDRQTGNEYIIVVGAESVAITPAPQKKNDDGK